MKFCDRHWQLMKTVVDDCGLTDLLNTADDPLPRMERKFSEEALMSGGPHLLGTTATGSNDGHFCPVCEFEKHIKGFNSRDIMERMACGIAYTARSEHLIPRVN